MLILYWNEVCMQFIEVVQSQTFRILVIMFRFPMFMHFLGQFILAHEFTSV